LPGRPGILEETKIMTIFQIANGMISPLRRIMAGALAQAQCFRLERPGAKGYVCTRKPAGG
jgi:hypothetical protein